MPVDRSPSDLDHHIRSYAVEVVDDCWPDHITSVDRFEAGDRHAVSKVSYVDPRGDTQAAVVRICFGNDDDERAQAEREAAVLERVQGHAAPRLYDARLDTPWFDGPVMCTQFLPGDQRDLATAAPGDIERLGSLVATIHALPTEQLVPWFPGTTTTAAYRLGRLDQVARKLAAVRDPLPAKVQRRLRDAVSRVTERRLATDDDDRLVLLHGDVATGNLVWTPEPVLIDWEYARLGDPADEIAYLFSQSGLSPRHRAAFWRGYRDTTRIDRVAWWEPLTLIGSALWWIERWSRRSAADAAGTVEPSAPEPPRYYLDHALRRLDRFEDCVASAADEGDQRRRR
jgi:thiamine kinase-like enzyme